MLLPASSRLRLLHCGITCGHPLCYQHCHVSLASQDTATWTRRQRWRALRASWAVCLPCRSATWPRWRPLCSPAALPPSPSQDTWRSPAAWPRLALMPHLGRGHTPLQVAYGFPLPSHKQHIPRMLKASDVSVTLYSQNDFFFLNLFLIGGWWQYCVGWASLVAS